MRLRLGATAAGVALIAAAVLGFGLASHPDLAGSNGVQPLFNIVFLQGGVRSCQQLPTLPAQTDGLQLGVSRTRGATRGLDVVVVDRRGRLARGSADRVAPGSVTIRLDRATPAHAVRHAGVCFTNPARGEIVLAGEAKRCTPRDTVVGTAAPCIHPQDKPAGQKYRFLVGIRFLRSGSTSWLSEANLILDRFGIGQAGWFGIWAAWVAVVLATLAAVLALWWLARDHPSNP